jgi:hypothetical protein
MRFDLCPFAHERNDNSWAKLRGQQGKWLQPDITDIWNFIRWILYLQLSA